MPPPKFNKPLTPEQVAVLKRWVEQGAKWTRHWALVPPNRGPTCRERSTRLRRRPIDCFILARLEREGLAPSPEAAKATLLRRVTLDLTGLPPTPAEVDAFLADDVAGRLREGRGPAARSRRATASTWPASGSTPPATATRTACTWTTTARCGRTATGSSAPSTTTCPSTGSSIEQLAGDLLPDADARTSWSPPASTAATSPPARAARSRRRSTSATSSTGSTRSAPSFLGLTIGCARCHDHKYDPITQKDYYSLFAFFNSIDGSAAGRQRRPARRRSSRVPTPEQAAALAELDEQDRRRAASRSPTRSPKVDVRRRRPTPTEAEAPKRQRLRLDRRRRAGRQPSRRRTAAINWPWKFVAQAEHPVLSGEQSLQARRPTGLSQHVVRRTPARACASARATSSSPTSTSTRRTRRRRSCSSGTRPAGCTGRTGART